MAAIITNKFRIHNSEQFVESFNEAAASVYYLAIGRPQAFGTKTRGDLRTDNEGSDTAPLTPVDSISDEFYYFDDFLAAKKIQTTDVSFVIPRRNWTTGTVYDYYRHDYGNRVTGGTTTQSANSGSTTLYDSTFYVINSSFKVYKCLDNNSNANSTVEPTGTSTSILSTGDGYKWKYMYTLTAGQQTNFLSTDFMAVATDSTISSAATDGAVNIVKIKAAGTGGADGTHANIDIRGDGSAGKVSVTVSSGAISAVTVTAKGSGYTFGYIRLADIVAAGATNLTGAELDCIIEPKGGHGFNAVEELGGFFVMLNTNFEGSETSNSGDFTVANDFRRVALVRDPKSGGSAASVNTLRGMKVVRFAASPTPGSFVVDEEINQATTGAVGKVVEYDSTNRLLYYVQTRYNDEGLDTNGNLTAFSGANVITGVNSSATGTPSTSSETVDNVVLTSGYAASELDADQGDVMYVENRAPITRASDQTENVKLIIEF
mgnify:CR=1 FL=1|tara:strand:+ start:6848 stop:8314 length:1467 start_codon:yes stop_codon:yes gene_type:complete